MKKIILPIIFFFLLGLAPPIEAQTVKITVKPTTLPTNQVEISTPQLTISINALISRLKAAEVRLDKISQKIASRLGRMKESKLNVTKLDSQYANISQQLLQLKQEEVKLEASSASFLGSTNLSRDYKSFRQQVLSINTSLKTILTSEKNIVSQMKRYPAFTITPAISAGGEN